MPSLQETNQTQSITTNLPSENIHTNREQPPSDPICCQFGNRRVSRSTVMDFIKYLPASVVSITIGAVTSFATHNAIDGTYGDGSDDRVAVSIVCGVAGIAAFALSCCVTRVITDITVAMSKAIYAEFDNRHITTTDANNQIVYSTENEQIDMIQDQPPAYENLPPPPYENLPPPLYENLPPPPSTE